MDRLRFKEMMNSETVGSLSLSDTNRILRKNLKTVGPELIQVIIMEELSELTKEVSKSIRKEGTRDDILEEMADVGLCLAYLSMIHHISDKEYQQAINTKVSVLIEKMEARDGYNPL